MKGNGNKGFSLIELIIVVAIMAILIGVLAPQYIKYVEKSRISVDEDMADTLLSVGYLMASDDDYVSGINVGDQIIYTRSGILLSPSNVTLSNGMDEFVEGWKNKKVMSKAYASQKYVVEFQGGGTTFRVSGGWQPNP